MSPRSRAPERPAPQRPALHQEVFDLFFELFTPLRQHFAASATTVGLSPIQAKALRLLETPLRMRELATVLECDASYVTAIVDQLEALNLVERRADPQDRRVKQIRITRTGRATRQRFEGLLSAGLPGAGELSDAELARLRDGLRKLRDGLHPAAG
jgi:DNA-binding MarR family transcriptional regulator